MFPSIESALSLWCLNFNTLITAAPATYGLAAPDAVLIDAACQDFIDALQTATDPGTRNASTVALKDVAKAAMFAVVRPFANKIKSSAGVTDGAKIAVGVGVRDLVPSPVASPNTQPLLSVVAATPLQHEIRYADAMTPDKRHKAPGAVALLLFCSVGVAAPADPAAAPFKGLVTKQPYFHTFIPADVGKTAFYYGRWVTRAGLLGPMSAVAAMTVV